MEFNIPRIVNAAMPDRGDRNVGIISSSSGPGHNDPGFLSNDFPRSPPKLYITSEDEEFDLVTLAEWRDEGFEVEYVPMGAGGNEYKMKIESLSRAKLGPCETFGIVGMFAISTNRNALRIFRCFPQNDGSCAIC